jgi:hypothetical protein
MRNSSTPKPGRAPGAFTRRWHLRSFIVSIQIEFPALDNLVAFLLSRDVQQQQLDKLTNTVNDLTEKLRQSSTVLAGAVESNSP